MPCSSAWCPHPQKIFFKKKEKLKKKKKERKQLSPPSVNEMIHLFFGHAVGLWDVSSPTRDRTLATAVKALSPNPGTIREFPEMVHLTVTNSKVKSSHISCHPTTRVMTLALVQPVLLRGALRLWGALTLRTLRTQPRSSAHCMGESYRGYTSTPTSSNHSIKHMLKAQARPATGMTYAWAPR